MGNPIVHWEVVGKDGKKLQEFYAKVFGWKISSAPQNYYLVDTDSGKGIAGGIGETAEGPGHVTVYVEADDLKATLDKVERAGGRTVVPVTEIPDMVTFALFADPEGHVVGLVKSEEGG